MFKRILFRLLLTSITAWGLPIAAQAKMQCHQLFPTLQASNLTSLVSEAELKFTADKALNYSARYFNTNAVFDSALLMKSWRRNDLFRDPSFYEALGTDPMRIQNIYEAWYGRPSKKFPVFLESLPPKLLALSLDPGIMGRMDDFLAFVPNYLKSNPRSSIADVRAAYSKKLGTKTYYRSLALTAEDAGKLKLSGLFPRAETFGPYVKEIYDHGENMSELATTRLEKELRAWANYLQDGPKRDMLSRINSGGNDSFSQSITEFPEVAVYVAKKFGRPNTHVYVFKLEIPVLEVTEAHRVTPDLGHSPFESLGKTFYMDQSGVEGFVIGNIPKEWIIGISEFGPSDGDAKFRE